MVFLMMNIFSLN